MLAVIDTNVFVSGLLKIHSTPARVVDLLYLGRLTCAFDDRILAEYVEGLCRPKFAAVISPQERRDLVDFLRVCGVRVLCSPLSATEAPDPADLPFAECAAAARADLLVTGNMSHFAFFTTNPWGVRVVTPAQCLAMACA